MKLLLLSTALWVVLINPSVAQFSFGAHVMPAFPIGQFGNTAETGFGFDVEGRYQTTGPLALSASIGYQSFGFVVAGVGRSGLSYNITPITFSFLYYLSEITVQPYLGLGVSTNRVGYDQGYLNIADSYFGVSPIFGLQYSVSDQVKLNLNIKYQHIFSESNANSVIVFDYNLAYVPFNLGVFYRFGE